MNKIVFVACAVLAGCRMTPDSGPQTVQQMAHAWCVDAASGHEQIAGVAYAGWVEHCTAHRMRELKRDGY